MADNKEWQGVDGASYLTVKITHGRTIVCIGIEMSDYYINHRYQDDYT